MIAAPPGRAALRASTPLRRVMVSPRVVIPPAIPRNRLVVQPPGPTRFVTELPMPRCSTQPCQHTARPPASPPGPARQLATQRMAPSPDQPRHVMSQPPAPPPAPPAPSGPARSPTASQRRPALELPARSRLVLQRRVVIPPRQLIAGRVVTPPPTISLSPSRRVMS